MCCFDAIDNSRALKELLPIREGPDEFCARSGGMAAFGSRPTGPALSAHRSVAPHLELIARGRISLPGAAVPGAFSASVFPPVGSARAPLVRRSR
jgi:hypothetical protein